MVFTDYLLCLSIEKETIIVNFVQYLPVEFGNQTKEETKESCKYKMKLFMRKVNKIPL